MVSYLGRSALASLAFALAACSGDTFKTDPSAGQGGAGGSGGDGVLAGGGAFGSGGAGSDGGASGSATGGGGGASARTDAGAGGVASSDGGAADAGTLDATPNDAALDAGSPCVNGTSMCVGTEVYVCRDDGAFTLERVCTASQICKAVVDSRVNCVDVICEPRSTQCHGGNQLETCSRDGTSSTQSDCGARTCALGRCAVVYDGFENGTGAWSDGEAFNAQTRTTTPTNPVAEGDRSLCIDENENGSHYRGLWRTFEPLQPTYFGYWVRPTVVGDFGYVGLNSRAPSALSPGAYEPDIQVVMTHFADDGTIVVFDGSDAGASLGSYAVDTWYHIEFKNFDWTAGTVDVWLDDELILDDLRLPNTDPVTRVHLYNYESATAYFDDVILE